MFVKICGITLEEDYAAVVESGADALGFVAYPKSPRYISPEKVKELILSRKSNILKVGVFVDAPLSDMESYIDAGIDVVQLHGDEPAETALKLAGKAEIWKAVKPQNINDIDKYRDYPADKFLIDAFCLKEKGGTGKTADWNAAKYAVETLKKPLILAGGLKKENVLEAFNFVKPFGIDLSSSVEVSPGIKNHSLIAEFMRKVREND